VIKGLQRGFWQFLIPVRNSVRSGARVGGSGPSGPASEEEREITIRRVTIDALKPREIGIIDLSKVLCDIDGVEEVDISVTEVDVRTETVKIVLKGKIDFESVSKIMEEYGVVIRSVDEVSVRKE